MIRAWTGITVAPGFVHAQDYPIRVITLVVPYAAGGNDAMAPTVADKMRRSSRAREQKRNKSA